MTKPDPLTPSSLAADPKVRAAYDAVDELFHDFHRRCTVGAERLDALIDAVRDATLKAHREQLVALTPEAVVEEARLAASLAMGQGLGTRYFSEVDQDYFDDAAKLAVRAALPVLLGPEVARREQAERTMAELARKTNVAEMAREQAEAERDRLREALEHLARPKRSPIDHEHALQCIAAIRRRARAALGGSNG